MSRISPLFTALQGNNQKALIPYIMVGDGGVAYTVAAMHALVEAGADIIELGMPFSDPMADGPVIVKAAERALATGASTNDVFAVVQQFRQSNSTTPIVLMGYLNPVEVMGYANFVKQCSAVGVDGVLIVDLPAESAGELDALLKQAGLDFIFLLSPTTTDKRMAHIVSIARGYVYYVSLKGVTGANASLDSSDVNSNLARIKAMTQLPIGVGFGIHNAATAQAVAPNADGVIVGSALVKLFAEDEGAALTAKLQHKMQELRLALDTL